MSRINAWHGADIGGLGAERRGPFDAQMGWQLVAADAVAWHRTGVDPGAAAVATDNPRPVDVRVVFLNKTDPARSVWGAWVEPAAGVPHLRHYRVKQGDITFFYCLSRDGLGNEQKLNCWIFAMKEGRVRCQKNMRSGTPESGGEFVIDGETWECFLEPLDKPSSNLR